MINDISSITQISNRRKAWDFSSKNNKKEKSHYSPSQYRIRFYRRKQLIQRPLDTDSTSCIIQERKAFRYSSLFVFNHSPLEYHEANSHLNFRQFHLDLPLFSAPYRKFQMQLLVVNRYRCNIPVHLLQNHQG